MKSAAPAGPVLALHSEGLADEIVEALGAATSTDFLDRLLASLLRVVDADIGFVGRIDATARAVDTVAVMQKAGPGAPFRYPLRGTPCADVLSAGISVHASGVADAFPDDVLLSRLRIEAYAGAPIAARDGRVFALLVAVARRPFVEPERVATVLRLFAARAGAEIEAADTEARLTAANRALRQALHARASSEARLQDFARSSADWFWEQDADLRFTYVSDGLRTVTGIDPALVIGRTREELREHGVLHRIESSWQALAARVAAREPFRDFDYVQRAVDGAMLHLRISGIPLVDEHGRFQGYRGTGRDVTALYEARERAQRTEQRLRDGIEAMPAGFALYDADDRLVLCNEEFAAFARSAGVPEPLPGQSFGSLVGLLAEAGHYGPFADVAARDAFVAERLARHRHPEGALIEQALPGSRWIEVRERTTAEGGKVLVRSDITDRKLSEQRLRDAIESLPVGFLLLDGDSRFVLCNRRYRELYPDAAETLVQGRPFDEICAAALAADGEGVIAYALDRQREASGVPCHYTTPAGRHLMITHTRTADGSTIGVHVDITPMVVLQHQLADATMRAEEALAVRTRFLANMSHELRTPLNAVIGFSDLMIMQTHGVLPDRYKEFAAIIKQSGEFLLSLIVDILDMARLEAGKMVADAEPVDLGAVAREVAAMLSLQAERKSLNLAVVVEPGTPPARGDRRRLSQIVQNLLSNAVKFTPAGSVRVGVEESGDTVLLSVADTGRGMTAEEIAFAMEPFQQARGRDGREVMEGTGLGLPLVKALAELQGGRFDLSSIPGEGTVARVWIPAARPPLADA